MYFGYLSLQSFTFLAAGFWVVMVAGIGFVLVYAVGTYRGRRAARLWTNACVGLLVVGLVADVVFAVVTKQWQAFMLMYGAGPLGRDGRTRAPVRRLDVVHGGTLHAGLGEVARPSRDRSSALHLEGTSAMPDIMMRLGRDVLVLDGAMGTMLQRAGLPAGECPELLNVTAPEMVADVHRLYGLAGADCVTTNTFGGSRPKLAEYGFGDRVDELNRAAVRIAERPAPSTCSPTSAPRVSSWSRWAAPPSTRCSPSSPSRSRRSPPRGPTPSSSRRSPTSPRSRCARARGEVGHRPAGLRELHVRAVGSHGPLGHRPRDGCGHPRGGRRRRGRHELRPRARADAAARCADGRRDPAAGDRAAQRRPADARRRTGAPCFPARPTRWAAFAAAAAQAGVAAVGARAAARRRSSPARSSTPSPTRTWSRFRIAASHGAVLAGPRRIVTLGAGLAGASRRRAHQPDRQEGARGVAARGLDERRALVRGRAGGGRRRPARRQRGRRRRRRRRHAARSRARAGRHRRRCRSCSTRPTPPRSRRRCASIPAARSSTASTAIPSRSQSVLPLARRYGAAVVVLALDDEGIPADCRGPPRGRRARPGRRARGWA